MVVTSQSHIKEILPVTPWMTPHTVGYTELRECSFEKCWGDRKTEAKPARNSCDPPKSNADIYMTPPPDKITTQAM